MTVRRPSSVRRVVLVVLAATCVVVSGCGGRARQAADRQLGVTSVAPTTGVSTTATSSTAPDVTTATSAGCPEPTAPLTSGQFSVDLGGTTREYLLQLPDGFDPTAPVPVILNFHGSGSNMTEQASYSELPKRGGARGYLVLTPQGTGSPLGWSLAGPGTDDDFVAALLAAMRAGACVDDARIFVDGISNGSAYAALFACRHPDIVAAVGMVAATLPSLCPVDDPMPAMAFHGTDDPIVPYGGGGVAGRRNGVEAPGAESAIAQWAQRNGCGAEPVETPIGPDVTERAWNGCTGHADVTFFSIKGGGHTWPGAIDLAGLGKSYLGATTQSVSATDRFLDFFDEVGRRAA